MGHIILKKKTVGQLISQTLPWFPSLADDEVYKLRGVFLHFNLKFNKTFLLTMQSDSQV